MYKTLIISTLIILLFGSCRNNYQVDDSSVFRYNENTGINSLDPAYARDKATIWVCNMLYNSLVELDSQARVKPSIAKSWTIDSSGLRYTFSLRNDVFFHDNPVFPNGKGRRVIAKDIVYSFNRIIEPSTASPGQWVFFAIAKNKKGKLKVYALDDSTLVISLSKKFPPLLGLLSMKYCSVVPFEAIEYWQKDFRSHPVGTGPFRFAMWKDGVKLVLRKNSNYFEKENGVRLPYLEAVAITFIIDQQSSFLEFAKGNLDLISGIDASYKDEILTPDGRLNPKYNSTVKLISGPYLNTEYLGICLSKNALGQNSPLRDKRVRQAINYGFDRVKMIRYLRNNIGIPGIGGIVPPGIPGFQNPGSYGYYYNPDRARDLLRQAGYPEGKGLPELVISTNNEYLDLCQYIQAQLAEIGVKIKISVMPGAELRDQMIKGNLKIFRASWIADYPDAENYLSLFYTQNFSPEGPNRTHYSNALFDENYNIALSEINNTIRYGMYRLMDSIATDEAPFIVLYYDEVLRFVRKEVSGLGTNPMNLLDLRRVKKK